MKRLISGSLLLALAGSAHAAVTASMPMFNQQNDDNRVERIMYSENKVVLIGGIVNQPFFIELKSDETIDDVAGGTIAGWDVHKKGYRLFIRALPNARHTTLLVTAPKHTYVFDLTPKKATPKNLEQRRSKIVFDYPLPAAPLAAVAAALPPLPPPSGYRNENYSMQVVTEDSDIRPREVFDDGRFTWLKFASNQEIPVIYRSTPGSREEVLVNSHRDGDYVVMHTTAPLWNLRLAKSMVGVFNDSYEAQGVAPVNNTTVHGMARESKQ
jgi:type IV secretion system protein VirB9